MKTILLAIALSLTANVLAASVKVTSFRYVRNDGDLNHPLAELCGVVEGASSEVTFIRAVVDATSRNPGTYNTIAGKDGKFCMAVITYRGTADLSLFGQSTSTSSLIEK